MNANTSTGPRRATAGIDWVSTDHAVVVADADGVALQRVTFEHTSAGLRSLVKTLRSADVDAVGIERPAGPVVDALLEAGFTVFVIAPISSRTCAHATARLATRTTASTPTSWPTGAGVPGPADSFGQEGLGAEGGPGGSAA